jgi:hypothetical protein
VTGGRIAKATYWQAFLRLFGTVSQRVTLPGWRCSADRSCLQDDSLLTGNFAGKFGIFELHYAIFQMETAVLQRFSRHSLRGRFEIGCQAASSSNSALASFK